MKPHLPLHVDISYLQGGPKKQATITNHYRIKTRHYGYIFHQFRLQNENKNEISLY